MLNVLEDRPRDRVLVALALGAGLRASELTGVKVGDVIGGDDGADWLRVVQGKIHKALESQASARHEVQADPSIAVHASNFS